MNFHFFYLLIIIYLLASCSSNTSKVDEKNIDHFKSQTPAELYKKNCVTCHGADGTLGMSGAKNLQISTLEKTLIITQVTNGKGMMTGFGDKLTTKEIEELAEYVITLRK